MTYPNPPAYPPGPDYGPPPKGAALRGRIPRRLGWIFLGVAVVLFVIGGVVVGTKSLGKVNSFQRVSFDSGGGTVTLSGTGKWIGYYEADDVTSSISRIPNFQVAVTGPSGAAVQVQTYGNRSDHKVDKLTYDYNGHRGAAAFQFTAERKGSYSIRLAAIDTLPAGAGVAVGRDIAGGTIAGGLLIGLGVLFLVAAVVLLIVGYVKKRRHRRDVQSGAPLSGAPQFGYPAPPPGYGTPPPGYPGQQPGYQGPPPGYQGPPPGYQGPPPGYQGPPPGYGGQQPGYQGTPPGYGEQQPGFGEQPGHRPPSGFGGPQGGYPPPTEQPGG